MSCNNCYWFNKDHLKEELESGKVYPCINIGVDGWHFWCTYQKAPEKCSGFCEKDKYKPTGVWAQMQSLINEVDEHIKEK